MVDGYSKCLDFSNYSRVNNNLNEISCFAFAFFCVSNGHGHSRSTAADKISLAIRVKRSGAGSERDSEQ